MDLEMLTIDDIRLYIRDRPELNRLLGDVEFTNEQIDQAMKLTVMCFNELSPKTQYTLENFPYQYTLLLGTLYHLLWGGGLSRMRNRLPYKAGDVQVDDEAHGQEEMQLSQQLYQQFMNAAISNKIEENVNAGWGIINSEYYYGNFWYRTR